MPGFTVGANFVGGTLLQDKNIVPGLAYRACWSSPLLPSLGWHLLRADDILIPVVLAIWALATLPQTMVAVGFSVVMNAVAGPEDGMT
jgi:hypothetical protein